MSTAQPITRAYDGLRAKILQRLLEARTSLDPTLARIDESQARAQISAVLEHIGNLIATGDLDLHQTFLRTFVAMRAAESQGPAQVLAMLVSIGDAAAHVAQEEHEGPGGSELTTVLTRVTAATARSVNDLVAEELERRLAHYTELSTKDQEALKPS